MELVVGYDRHPASRAAVRFAGQLAGAAKVSGWPWSIWSRVK